MTAFYLTLFKPLKPGDGEWHMEWTLLDFRGTVNAICGGDFADFEVSRVLRVDPVGGFCTDWTSQIAEDVCSLTHHKQYRPDANTRAFLEAHGFDGWFKEAA